jgi:aspartate/methionine/tyrosine aminotransferase
VRLVNALAQFYAPLLGRRIEPLSEILVTVGGAQAMHCVMQAVLSPNAGESVLMFEPFFDFFNFQTRLAGARPIGVPLVRATEDANWIIDFNALEQVVESKTKLIVVNSPMNPLGKRFDFDELLRLAHFARRHRLRIVADEVYEWMTFDQLDHVRIAALHVHPRAAAACAESAENLAAIEYARANTYVIGSAGKTFSVTGWKLGWLIAPAPLVTDCLIVHQYTVYVCCTPLQEALAIAFESAQQTREYLASLCGQLQRQRDKLMDCLSRITAITAYRPSGAYFVLVDISRVADPGYGAEDRGEGERTTHDFVFCRWLARVVRVGAVPATPFFTPEHRALGENLVRFAFPKTDATLDLAIERLSQLQHLLKEKEQ